MLYVHEIECPNCGLLTHFWRNECPKCQSSLKSKQSSEDAASPTTSKFLANLYSNLVVERPGFSAK